MDASRGLGRDYWRLWSADGLSNLADGTLKVGLPLIALAYTRSPALIAGLAFVITLPWLLFALPVGALVDRVDRRRAMLAANTVRAGAVAAVVIVVAAGYGCWRPSLRIRPAAAGFRATPTPPRTPPRRPPDP